MSVISLYNDYAGEWFIKKELQELTLNIYSLLFSLKIIYKQLNVDKINP